MENKSNKMLHDNKEGIQVDNTSTNTNHPEIGVDKGVLKNFTRSSGDVAETKIAADWKGGENCQRVHVLRKLMHLGM
uniref:Uncharacterized protein n=1 Tax=Glycine max TaxID=3847 RepID=C6TA90_SOYBN|nr:unknown [Glycine max]